MNMYLSFKEGREKITNKRMNIEKIARYQENTIHKEAEVVTLIIERLQDKELWKI